MFAKGCSAVDAKVIGCSERRLSLSLSVGSVLAVCSVQYHTVHYAGPGCLRRLKLCVPARGHGVL